MKSTLDSSPGGAVRVAAFPVGIEWCAGPADDASAKNKKSYGHDDHAPWFTLNVRNGIERDLTAGGGGVVAAELGGEGVGGFVAGGGKEKDYVQDEIGGELLRCEIVHGESRVEVVKKEVKKDGEQRPVAGVQRRRAVRGSGDPPNHEWLDL